MYLSKFNRFAFILFIIFGIALPALSQTAKPTPPEEIIKVDSRLVVVPVSVTDSAGQPVLGLKAQDFRIAEEGKAQLIEQVSDAEKVPLEIALLFDISASTDPMFKFEQETAAKFLREVMRPGDHATVFTIGESTVLVKARDTAENAAAAITSIVPTKQFTAFYDAVAAAAEFLRKAPPGTRRVAVVISDGEDTNSVRIAKAIQDGYTKLGKKVDTLDNKTLYELTVANRNAANVGERNRVLQTLQNADTVFYSINPAGSSYQLNKISMFGQENMQKFAVETGGTAFLPQFSPTDLKDKLQNFTNTKKNTSILENIFRRLANELRAQYLVQYYSEAEYPNNKYVKLGVGLQNQAGRQIRARQGYFAKK
jgi:Ca-activated chloride channel family protein